MSAKVVHISPTPLVGAPGKISRALCQAGYESSCFVFSDYPEKGPLARKFLADSILLNEGGSQIKDLVSATIADAEIVHVHNSITAEQSHWVRELATHAAFVYQVHSPLREGPLYYQRAEQLNMPFDRHLVVGQYQPRHYQNYTPVPNLVLDMPGAKPWSGREPLRVHFSPTHTRGGRWNSKGSEVLTRTLEALQSLGKVEIVSTTNPVSPSMLMAIRKQCHITIDEIVTGAFHQVSIEGLCAGNIVINRADYFSKAMMAQCAGAPDLPPFVHADDKSILQTLLRLYDDPEETRRLQQAGLDYFKEHLRPNQLIKPFCEVYEDVLVRH